MPMQAPAKKKPRRRLWVTLGVVGGLLVVFCAGGVGLFVYAAAQAAKPLEVATTFCADVKARDYSSAYGLLSTNYQSQIKQSAYVQTAQLQDQVDGPVKNCGLQTGNSSSFSFDFNRKTASVAAQIVRNKALTGNIALVEEGSDWKIDSLDASLQGTDVGPLETGNSFCAALAAGNYGAAWQEFSADFKSKDPESQYVNGIKQGLAQLSQQYGVAVKIGGCKLQLSTYTVSADDTSASVTSDLIVTAGAQSGDQPQKMALVKESDGWRIDSLTNIAASS